MEQETAKEGRLVGDSRRRAVTVAAELLGPLLEIVQADYRDAARLLHKAARTLGYREAQLRRKLQESSDEHRSNLSSSASRVPSGAVSTATTSSSIRINSFGPFEVWRDGVRLEQGRHSKALTILKYLIANRARPVPKEVLIEVLWPAADPEAANNSLKVAIHNLRRALADPATLDGDCLIFRNGCYLLNPSMPLWIDVEEFERNWQQGRRLEQAGRHDEAAAHYLMAGELYRGDFLEEDAYEEWTILRREGLIDTYLMIQDKLGEYCLQQNDYEGCIIRCQRILAKDPCREDTYRRLMYCHARLGHVSRALRWYQVCAKTLQEELEVTPSQETMDLYHKLRLGQGV